MSFIKKALSKVWDFVKDHWVEIVMVAAVAFTAGVSTVGWSAFKAAAAEQGFFSAVGSTMWAGVTATAGSMGIGGGASGSVAASAGATGYGVGAAWGAGSGFGLGAAGNTAEAAAAEAALQAGTTDAVAAGMIPDGGIGIDALNPLQSTTPGQAPGLMPGAPEPTGMMPGLVEGAEAEKGMSMGKALLWSNGLQTVGGMAEGYAQGMALEEQLAQNIPKASWGVATEDRGGREGSVEDYLFEGAVMQPLGGGPDGATETANAMAMQQAQRPLMVTTNPIRGNMPGKTDSPGDFDGVAYNPQQMLDSPGLGKPTALMGGDPRRQATRKGKGFSLMSPMDQWRLNTYGQWA